MNFHWFFVKILPNNNAKDVPVNSKIYLKFASPMYWESVKSAFSISPIINGTFTNDTTKDITFTPEKNLEYETKLYKFGKPGASYTGTSTYKESASIIDIIGFQIENLGSYYCELRVNCPGTTGSFTGTILIQFSIIARYFLTTNKFLSINS